MGIFEGGILTKMTEDEYELLGRSQTVAAEDPSTALDPGKPDGTTDTDKTKSKASQTTDDMEGIRPISIKMVQGAFIVVMMGHSCAGFIFYCPKYLNKLYDNIKIILGLVLIIEIKLHGYVRKNPQSSVVTFVWVTRIKFKLHVARKRAKMWTVRKYNRLKEEMFLALLDYVD